MESIEYAAIGRRIR
ncbi:Protein of unknown function [Bacillus mycoides]|nr:Protein of unknown function [Bacillus mycoides]